MMTLRSFKKGLASVPVASMWSRAERAMAQNEEIGNG